jgi:hypothetical protein
VSTRAMIRLQVILSLAAFAASMLAGLAALGVIR